MSKKRSKRSRWRGPTPRSMRGQCEMRSVLFIRDRPRSSSTIRHRAPTHRTNSSNTEPFGDAPRVVRVAARQPAQLLARRVPLVADDARRHIAVDIAVHISGPRQRGNLGVRKPARPKAHRGRGASHRGQSDELLLSHHPGSAVGSEGGPRANYARKGRLERLQVEVLPLNLSKFRKRIDAFADVREHQPTLSLPPIL